MYCVNYQAVSIISCFAIFYSWDIGKFQCSLINKALVIVTFREKLWFGEVEYNIIGYLNLGTSSLCPVHCADQGRIFIISHGGVWTNHGGCNFFPDNGLARRRFAPPQREFFPDIGLLARCNFAHTIQDLL